MKCCVCLAKAEVSGSTVFRRLIIYYCRQCNRSWRHDCWREDFTRHLVELRQYLTDIDQVRLEGQIARLEERIRGLAG